MAAAGIAAVVVVQRFGVVGSKDRGGRSALDSAEIGSDGGREGPCFAG